MCNEIMQWTQVRRDVTPYVRKQTPEVANFDNAAGPMQC